MPLTHVRRLLSPILAAALLLSPQIPAAATSANAPSAAAGATAPTAAAPTAVSAQTRRAGSLAPGKTNYAVPSNAMYVVPAGSRTSGSGSKASPIAGVQRAINAAPSGSTLVLRAGTYRESVAVPFRKKLTVQSAPGEAVWFDGSRRVSDWTRSGSTWVAPWSTFFDSRVSFTAGQDETSWWVNRAYPMAGHPDQVWLGGRQLSQVGSRAAVKAGTFYADKARKQLVIGTNPTGKVVEASALAKAIKIQGEGTTVRGIGVQRYATTTALMGAVSAEVDDITLENVVIRDNATVGLFIWNDDKRIRNVTVSGNGMLGIGVNRAKNLQVRNTLVTGNNTSRFNHAPVAGGMKISRGTDVTVSESIFSANIASAGLWFDVSSSNLKVTNNVLVDNGREGLEIELSHRALVAGNYIARNLNNGAFVFDSDDVDIWNNTFVGNKKTITYMQDERRQSDPALKAKIPWVTRDIVVRNNVMAYGAGPCPVLSQDLTNRWYGKDFGISQDANLYHRQSASSPANFACWADGPKGTRGVTTIEAFRNLTGSDRRSVLRQGAPIVDAATWQLTVSNPVTGAYPLPAAIATAVGVSAKTATVGAPRPPVVAR